MKLYRPIALILILVLVLSLSSAWAGSESNFTVTSFIPQKFRDLQWRINGDFELNKATNRNYNPDQPDNSGDYNVNLGSSLTSATSAYSRTYYKYYTPDLFYSAALLVNSSFNFSRTDNKDTLFEGINYREDHNKSHSMNYGLMISPSIDIGRYLISDFFVSATPSVNVQYVRSPSNNSERWSYSHQFYEDEMYMVNTYQTGETKTSTTSRMNSFSINITPGYGRVYSGVYGATALYIINELRDKNLLKAEPSHDDMMVLSEIIYKYQQQHVVDYRIHRIDGFTEIQSFLASKNIIDNNGASSLVIQDVWDYFPNDSREFGWKVTGGMGYEYIYQSGQNSQNLSSTGFSTGYYVASPSAIDTLSNYTEAEDRFYHSQSNRKDFSLIVGFEHHKPLSFRWQLDNTITGSYSLFNKYYANTSYRFGDDIYVIERKTNYKDSYQLRVKNNLSYLISSRSTARWQMITQYIRDKMKTDWISNYYPSESESEVSHQFGLSFLSSLDYRISIPTTLSASINIYTNDWGSNYPSYNDDNHSLNYSISIGLTHYLY